MRLLLADDEKELTDALCVILRHNQFEVDIVDNGVDAFDYLQADNYDAAILDIMMPGMDGITVLKRLREKGNKLPILMLTAKSQVDDRVLGLDCGADDYLTKPFAAKELLARLRAILRRQNDAGDNLLIMGNLTLNRGTFTLESPTGIIRLVGKEYQILELMMANPGQPISAERFLERLWGFDTETETNVVWVYISSLRKRLVALQANIQIRSCRNTGYLMEVHL